MNCELMMEWMQRFVDEDLTQTEEQQLMIHISQCPDCAASFEQLQRLSAELSLLPMVVPPFSIVDSILPKLAELDAQQAAIHVAYMPTASRNKAAIFSWKAASGVAAAAAIFILIAVNLSPNANFDAREMIKVGSTAANGSQKAAPEATMSATKDSNPTSVENFSMSITENSTATSQDKRSGTGTSDKKPEATVDKTEDLKVKFGPGEYSKKSQELTPQPSPSPTPAPAPAAHGQTLASDDGNFIGLVERQIVQVQTPDGIRIYTSSFTWKSTDTISLLLWQDNQRLTYEVKMKDGLVKRFIIDPILKTEKEQKVK